VPPPARLTARSVSRALLPFLSGPELEGVGIGAGHLDFGRLVVSVTPPGAPRMPNGLEVEAVSERGWPARIGGGRLLIGATIVQAGPAWDPVPAAARPPATRHHLRPDPARLAGRGPGLTPAGDDLLCGYVAGLTLFHGRRAEAVALANAAAEQTTRLAATLLRHAARGELPEPAHAFLADGDASTLACFGHSSGRCLRLGLELAAEDAGPRVGLEILLPLALVENLEGSMTTPALSISGDCRA